ncbi:MAG: ketoacid CoA transferase [Deltaproteobacteria bacterium]|nr:ketoacid CoA transferase [Deltaproteobacteria bacterium]
MTTSGYTLAELCITAAAEAWRGDGEVLASGLGLVPRLAAGLARLTFGPDLMMTDAECLLVAEPVPVGKRPAGYRMPVEGWLPFRKVFDLLWSGRRHAMTMPTQIDRFGTINISYIGGTFEKPKVQLLGVRGIPGNTINHPCSFFIPDHSTRAFVERVDMASGAGYDPARWQPGVRRDLHELRLVVTNLAVLDFGGPGHAMRLRSVHPGVSIEQVEAATSFPLARAADVGETPAPTEEQLRLIRTVLDPHDTRATVFKK